MRTRPLAANSHSLLVVLTAVKRHRVARTLTSRLVDILRRRVRGRSPAEHTEGVAPAPGRGVSLVGGALLWLSLPLIRNSVPPGNGITGLPMASFGIHTLPSTIAFSDLRMMANVGSTLGTLYIGQQFAIFLFGVSVVQSWTFAKRCGQDPLHLKAAVLVIMIFGLLEIIMLSCTLYSYLIPLVGDPSVQERAPWTSRAMPFFTGPVILIVQWSYGLRLYRLTKNIALLAAIAILGLAVLVLNYTCDIADLRRQETNSSMIAKIASCAALVTAMVVDAIITIGMLRFLWTHKTGLKTTENILSSLMVYTLASGLSTFVLACATVVTFLALPDFLDVSYALTWTLSHSYTISFLALLNARRSLRQQCVYTSVAVAGGPAQTALPPFFVPRRNRSWSVPSTTMDIEQGLARSPRSSGINLEGGAPQITVVTDSTIKFPTGESSSESPAKQS